MKADEYMVLLMAIEEGVKTGFLRMFPDDGGECPDPILESRMENQMIDAVTDSILGWFHIERP
jgi:hypothetical protein